MPDHRKHRGPHPQDARLFAAEREPVLRAATDDLSWLLTKGYAPRSAMKLVGDRYALDARQRLGVSRCACGIRAAARRREHRVTHADVRGQELWIDGYNVLTSLEAGLAGGVILKGRDDCYRDMASMHGNYRKVDETRPAIAILGELLSGLDVSTCRWLLDEPVSNSGRLKTLLRETAEDRGWCWQIELVRDPDQVLRRADEVVASSDSQILDRAPQWFNLAGAAIDHSVPDAWIVDLSSSVRELGQNPVQ